MKRFFWTAVLVSAVAAQAATISIQPASTAASVGEMLGISVQVADVMNLYAFQFDIAFDPAVLSAASVTEGGFLSAEGASFFIPGVIDNAVGTVTLTANTLLGPAAGVSGNGTLASLSLLAKRPGASAISISNVVLLDSVANDITATIANGSVEVGGTAVVPEPGSGTGLFLAGVAFAARWVRSKTTPSCRE